MVRFTLRDPISVPLARQGVQPLIIAPVRPARVEVNSTNPSIRPIQGGVTDFPYSYAASRLGQRHATDVRRIIRTAPVTAEQRMRGEREILNREEAAPISQEQSAFFAPQTDKDIPRAQRLVRRRQGSAAALATRRLIVDVPSAYGCQAWSIAVETN